MPAGTRTFVMKFVGDAKQAISEMNKLDDKFNAMGTGGKVAVAGALAGGAAIGGAAVGVFTKAISVAADYEKAIVSVGVKANASAAEQKGLWDKGLEVGMKTKFSALESADAMIILAKNGITAGDIMGHALDATVSLAAAADTNLGSAADTVSKAMTIWGLKTEDMTGLVNRLTGASNASLFTVEDFNLAISQGGGAAALAGVEYDDFITLLAATSSTFASGSDAGTSFKTMFTKLNPQTKAAKKEMEALGLWTAKSGSAFYDAKGNLKDGVGIIETLHEATKDLTEAERVKAFQTIFGTDAIRASAMAAKFTGDEYTKMHDALGKTDSAGQAAAQMDNAADAMEQFRGAIEVIQIQLGAKFLPVVQKIALFLAEWLPKIPTEVFLVVGAFAAFIGIMSAVGLAVLPLIALFGPLGLAGAAAGLAPLIAAAFPFLLVAAAVAAIIAAGYLLFTHWDEVKRRAGEVWSAIANNGITGSGNFAGGKRSASASAADARAGLGITVGDVAQWGGGMGEFGSGGIVPGPRGSRQLAMVHGGETILPTHKGGGFGNITINVEGSVHTDSDLQSAILGALRTAQQRGDLGFA